MTDTCPFCGTRHFFNGTCPGEIPDFLRISTDERRAAWKSRRLTVQGSGFRRIDKQEEALRKRLQREYDEQQKAKRAARLAAFLESRRA